MLVFPRRDSKPYRWYLTTLIHNIVGATVDAIVLVLVLHIPTQSMDITTDICDTTLCPDACRLRYS